MQYNPHNYENFNTFNILPKYQPFSKRFNDRANKIKTIAKQNWNRPPVPSSYDSVKANKNINWTENRFSQIDSFALEKRNSDSFSKKIL